MSKWWSWDSKLGLCDGTGHAMPVMLAGFVESFGRGERPWVLGCASGARVLGRTSALM